MKKEVIRAYIILFILLITGILYLRLVYFSHDGLRISCYDISAAVTEPIRIVQLSDLHNSEFGADNQRLVQTVAEQNPDLIFLTGDLLNDDDPDASIAVNLIEKLSHVAPVFASYGNHELTYEDTFHADLAQLYQEAGATFLDFSWEDVTVNDTPLRIGGVYGYCLPAEYLSTNETRQDECDFLTEFQDTNLPTLLLCHLPVSWLGRSLNSWDVDVVFSGHLHGGQVILPGVGGLYAPDMGWFPGRLWGTYQSEDQAHTLVLSCGLGSAEHTPRINNIPEIVVVDLLPNGQ